MSEAFNQLTPAQAERLAMLAEECAEVIQIIGKILRHGYDSHHPDRPAITNRMMLCEELTDLMAVHNEMSALDRLYLPFSTDVDRAWEKKLRYAHHQEARK